MIPKVVFLNPWDRLIGPNRYLIEILRNLPDLARQSTIVFDQATDAAEEYEDLQCSVQVWPEIQAIHPRMTVRNAAKVLEAHTGGVSKVLGRLRSIRPDVVVSNTENLWIGGITARLLGIPHLQIFHAITFKDRLGTRPFVLKTYLRFLSAMTTRFIAVSGAVQSALESAGVDTTRIVRVANPIDTLGFKGARVAPDRDKSDSNFRERLEIENLEIDNNDSAGNIGPIIVCAGRISQMKGQDLLVKALPAVRDKFPRVKCLFAGRVGSNSGLDNTKQFHEELLAEVASLGLEPNVTFLGEVDDLPALLAQADVYVQPSRTESFGRVICEALICGTPVGAFAVGGIPEAAGPGALLATPGDIAGLSDAIITLLGNGDLAKELAEKGRAYVCSNFEASDVAQQFLGVIADSIPVHQFQERAAWTQS